MSCGSLARSCALNPVYVQAHQGVTKSCGNPSENENTCLQFRTFAALRCHASRLGAHEMSHCEEERNSDGEASRSVCAVGTLAVSHLRYQQRCEPASNSSHSCQPLPPNYISNTPKIENRPRHSSGHSCCVLVHGSIRTTSNDGSLEPPIWP